jgi:hypothetical protein
MEAGCFILRFASRISGTRQHPLLDHFEIHSLVELERTGHASNCSPTGDEPKMGQRGRRATHMAQPCIGTTTLLG